MSASAKKPWRKFIKRGNLQGGGRGKEGKPSFRGEAAYVRRLRRLEVIVLHLTNGLELAPKVLDSMLNEMLILKDVVEPKAGSGTPVQGDAVPVSHEGAPDGEAEGKG